MANIKSAKKRIKTNERDRKQNVAGRSKIKTLIKKIATVSEEKQAKELVSTIYSQLDKASKAVMHKNKASRLKSRIAQKAKKLAVK